MTDNENRRTRQAAADTALRAEHQPQPQQQPQAQQPQPRQDVATPVVLRRSVLFPTLPYSPVDNMPDSVLTPAVSPDEEQIQLRGRRNVSIIWSPDKAFHCVSPSKTPTKAISSMTLRSSPRKRTLISELSATGTPERGNSPMKRHLSARFNGSPVSNTKKPKLESGSMNRSNGSIPLETLLKGYSQQQLIQLIGNMVRGNATLEGVVRGGLTVPDIGPLEDQLTSLQKNVARSWPTTRLVNKTDSLTYARAATHLDVFKRTITEHCQNLHSSYNWDALLDYVMMAWGHVRALPVWETQAHNAIRRNCFKILATHAGAALKHGSVVLGSERITLFNRKYKTMANDCEDMNGCGSYLHYLMERC